MATDSLIRVFVTPGRTCVDFFCPRRLQGCTKDLGKGRPGGDTKLDPG